jgi:hypothetical protein
MHHFSMFTHWHNFSVKINLAMEILDDLQISYIFMLNTLSGILYFFWQTMSSEIKNRNISVVYYFYSQSVT